MFQNKRDGPVIDVTRFLTSMKLAFKQPMKVRAFIIQEKRHHNRVRYLPIFKTCLSYSL